MKYLAIMHIILEMCLKTQFHPVGSKRINYFKQLEETVPNTVIKLPASVSACEHNLPK